MDVNETVKSIHRLATMRDGMGDAPRVSILLTPHGGGSPNDTGEIADSAPAWSAQTYQGKGKWGNLLGEGATPEDALENLRESLLIAHRAVDERRAAALKASVMAL